MNCHNCEHLKSWTTGKRPGHDVTTHLHLVPRLSMSWAMPLHPCMLFSVDSDFMFVSNNPYNCMKNDKLKN
jgi:hypothetical protein